MTDDTDNPGSKSRPVETTEGAWEEYKARELRFAAEATAKEMKAKRKAGTAKR
jgi:hypothetical protein